MESGVWKRRVLSHRAKPLDGRRIIVGQQVEPPEIVGDVARFPGQLLHLLELSARFVVAAQGQQANCKFKVRLGSGRIGCQSLFEFAGSRFKQLFLHELHTPAERAPGAAPPNLGGATLDRRNVRLPNSRRAREAQGDYWKQSFHYLCHDLNRSRATTPAPSFTVTSSSARRPFTDSRTPLGQAISRSAVVAAPNPKCNRRSPQERYPDAASTACACRRPP